MFLSREKERGASGFALEGLGIGITRLTSSSATSSSSSSLALASTSSFASSSNRVHHGRAQIGVDFEPPMDLVIGSLPLARTGDADEGKHGNANVHAYRHGHAGSMHGISNPRLKQRPGRLRRNSGNHNRLRQNGRGREGMGVGLIGTSVASERSVGTTQSSIIEWADDGRFDIDGRQLPLREEHEAGSREHEAESIEHRRESREERRNSWYVEERTDSRHLEQAPYRVPRPSSQSISHGETRPLPSSHSPHRNSWPEEVGMAGVGDTEEAPLISPRYRMANADGSEFDEAEQEARGENEEDEQEELRRGHYLDRSEQSVGRGSRQAHPARRYQSPQGLSSPLEQTQNTRPERERRQMDRYAYMLARVETEVLGGSEEDSQTMERRQREDGDSEAGRRYEDTAASRREGILGESNFGSEDQINSVRERPRESINGKYEYSGQDGNPHAHSDPMLSALDLGGDLEASSGMGSPGIESGRSAQGGSQRRAHRGRVDSRPDSGQTDRRRRNRDEQQQARQDLRSFPYEIENTPVQAGGEVREGGVERRFDSREQRGPAFGRSHLSETRRRIPSAHRRDRPPSGGLTGARLQGLAVGPELLPGSEMRPRGDGAGMELHRPLRGRPVPMRAALGATAALDRSVNAYAYAQN
jgi:hypothetical protein